jgi:lipopolysaccharide transport system ATP-binding protein
MTKAEIRSKFDGIVAFSEIEEFIDTPVKRYSSGMYVRLAFAVAAHLEPEILVLDEVLAVGDAQFQKKCLGKMDDVSRQGRTVLFVSHNLAAVQKLCSKGALLDGGRLVGFGPIDAIIEAYRGNLETTELTWSAKENVIHKSAYIERISLQSAQGSTGSGLRTTDTLQLCIRLKCQATIPGAQVAVRFVSEDGIAILTSTSTDETCEAHFIEKGTHYIKVTIPPNFLAPVYISTICAILRPGGEVIDAVEDGLSFKLDDGLNHASVLGDHRRGVVTPIFHWDWEARV